MSIDALILFSLRIYTRNYVSVSSLAAIKTALIDLCFRLFNIIGNIICFKPMVTVCSIFTHISSFTPRNQMFEGPLELKLANVLYLNIFALILLILIIVTLTTPVISHHIAPLHEVLAKTLYRILQLNKYSSYTYMLILLGADQLGCTQY
jgi:hypothetical protein